MRSSTLVASLLVVATGASAQVTASPLALLGYAESFLSASCKSTLETLFNPNSTLGGCLAVQELVPTLLNTNTSIIENLDEFFKYTCAHPACTPATIHNATTSIQASCGTDLSNFGISNSTFSIITGAYATAREVVCLSTNSTEAFEVSNTTLAQSSMFNSTLFNSTRSSNSTNSTTTANNTILCPTSLLYEFESFIGTPLTNSYIDTLLLGGNATALNQLLSIATNVTVLQDLACNDCIAGSLDVILENYPVLANYSINLSSLTSYVNATNITIPSNTSLTVPQIYGGFCNVSVGYNVTLPKSINETAYNTTLPYNATATSSNATSSTIVAHSTGIASILPTPSTPLNITSRAEVAAKAARKRFGGN